MDLTYLTTPNPAFGAPEWVFFIAQFVVAIAGAYLTFMHRDAHPVRGAALRNLGYGLLIVGLLGAVVGALRRSAVEPFTAPYWMTIITVVEALLAIGAIAFFATQLPGRIAAYDAAHRSRGGKVVRAQPAPRPTQQRSAGDEHPSPTTNGAVRTPGSGSRRASRRDNKRKHR